MGQMLGCVKVKQSHVGIKEVFDKYDDVLQPGCHYVPWYFGHRLAATHSLGFMTFKVPVGAKTKDNVYVTVQACIQYQLLEEMVVEAHYKVGNPATHISLYVANAIRSLAPKMELNSLYDQRNEIATAVEKEIGKDMSAIGFEIVKIFLSYTLDEPVRKAVKDAMKLKVETKAKAEAEKMLQLNKAEGAAESKYLTGLGMARQFQAIADGVSDSKLTISESEPNATAATSSKDIMDMVLTNQYYDTVKELVNAVFTSNGKIAVSQVKDATAAVKDIASQVKDGLVLVQGNVVPAAKGAVASQVKNSPVQVKGKTQTKP